MAGNWQDADGEEDLRSILSTATVSVEGVTLFCSLCCQSLLGMQESPDSSRISQTHPLFISGLSADHTAKKLYSLPPTSSLLPSSLPPFPPSLPPEATPSPLAAGSSSKTQKGETGMSERASWEEEVDKGVLGRRVGEEGRYGGTAESAEDGVGEVDEEAQALLVTVVFNQLDMLSY